jgi:hypothetical protein
MKNKATYKHRLLIVGACLVTLGFVGCAKPEPPQPPPPSPPEIKPGALLSDLEIVKIRLENRGGGIYQATQGGKPTDGAPPAVLDFSPPTDEPSVIFFFAEGEGPEPGKPNAVRWEFAGLEAGHKVYITPKEGSSTTLFAFPELYDGKPAFVLSPPNDTLYSGPAIKESFSRLFENAKGNFSEGEKPYISWFYSVEIVDSEGKVVAEIDPETQVQRYP